MTGPPWFTSPPGGEGLDDVVEVAGVPIHHRVWGRPSMPGLVLVHGGAGHLHWWSPVAGLLAHRHRVVALDLSGHGDSGWRERYDLRNWAGEVMAVVDRHFTAPPTLAGHSMGGAVVAAAAVAHGDRLRGAIVLDAPVWRDTTEVHREFAERSFSRLRVYPTRQAAVDRFRLVPEQPNANLWYLDHIAQNSVRSTEGGWTWKFDPRVFSARDRASLRADEFGGDLVDAACPVSIVIGERSYLADDPFPLAVARGDAVTGTAAGLSLHIVADAAHHLMLDQPEAVADIIAELAAAPVDGDVQSA